MMTYLILIATFIIAAALACIPVAIILGRLGFSEAWAGLLFIVLVAAPFIPGYLIGLLPVSVLNSMSIPALGGVLKIVEWTPALVFLWVFALRKTPKDAARS
jgi:hypothetical protein